MVHQIRVCWLALMVTGEILTRDNVDRFCSEMMFDLSEARSWTGDVQGAAGLLGEILSVHTSYGVIPPRMLAEVLKCRSVAFVKMGNLSGALEAVDELNEVLQGISDEENIRTRRHELRNSSGGIRWPSLYGVKTWRRRRGT